MVIILISIKVLKYMSCQLKHLLLIPAGTKEWISIHSADKIEAYKLSFEKLHTIILKVFERYKIPYLTTYLLDIDEESNTVSLASNFLEKLAEKANVDIKSVVEIPEPLIKVLRGKRKNVGNNRCRCLVLYCYDPEEEIVDACRKICAASKNNYFEIANLISDFLLTSGLPEVDLLIKTKGKAKIPIWQSSYAEIYLIDKYWPEVCFDDIEKGIQDFFKRKRRFGK